MSTLSPGSRGSSPGLTVTSDGGSRPTTPQRRPGSGGAFFTTIRDPTEPKSLDLSGSRGKSSSNASSPGVTESPVSIHHSGGKLEARPWGSRSSHTRLVIKGGRIVNDDRISEGDVYIEDGIIKQVGKDLIIPGGTRAIDARGKFVIPGGIDANVHLQLPFMGAKTADDFYQGTKAALAGGTTMIIGCALDQGSLLESYEKWRSLADEKVCCDYGLSVAVTSWSPAVQSEMELLAREKGISAFDVYMAYKGSLMLRDDSLIEVLKTSKNLGAFVRVHAENGDIVAENEKRLLAAGVTGPEGVLLSRPDEIEAEATQRAIVLGNQINCPVYIQRMTGKEAADVLLQKRSQGCIAMGEVLAAALASDGGNYYNKCWNHAAGHVTCPPLRADPNTPDQLLEYLNEGNLQVVSSDHRPFTSSQKAAGTNDFTLIPHGVNGVEERMSIVWHQGVNAGKLDPCKFVAVTSTNAAKYFNIYPRKGCVQAGADADVVIWNPNAKKTITVKNQQSQADFNVFEGLEVKGGPEFVISQGRIILEDGQLHVSQGVGHFVATPPFSPYIYVALMEKEKGKGKVQADSSPTGDRGAPSPTSSAGDSYQNGDGVEDEIRARKFTLPLQSPNAKPEFHTRPPTRSGGRNLQDSSFSLSGAQIDDTKSPRSGIRVHNPPGGRSTGLW